MAARTPIYSTKPLQDRQVVMVPVVLTEVLSDPDFRAFAEVAGHNLVIGPTSE
jgi:hypothetical protein